jgi:hypothetical protein
MITETISKHLVEGKVKNDIKALTALIKKPKSGKISVDGTDVKMTSAGGMLIFEYPNKMDELTYNLVQASDDLKKKTQQIGLRSAGNMKFMVEL